MKKIFSNIHIFIILYACAEIYLAYEDHKVILEQKKNAIPNIENQIRVTKRKKKQLQNYYKDIEEAKERIELVAQEVEKIQRKLPETISDTENLQLIKRIAEGLKLKNVFLTPGAEINKGFYFLKQYDFKASGTFLQFVIFFERIAENERLLNVKSIDLAKASQRQRGRFQIINVSSSIEAYRYNSGHKVSRGLDDIEEDFKKTQAEKLKKAREAKRKKKK